MPVYRRIPWRGAARAITPRMGALHESSMFAGVNTISDPQSTKLLERRTESVCFTGHRFIGKADAPYLARLAELLELLYERGYRDYLCGGALGFDLFAAEQVVVLRNRHPDVRLISCIPCEEQCTRWRANDQNRYRRLLYLSDEVRVLSSFYYEGCMQVRNKYMVDRSSVCVSYLKRPRGGTMSTSCYASSQDLILVNLGVITAVDEYAHAYPL